MHSQKQEIPAVVHHFLDERVTHFRQARYLIAVSGGIDSVVLAHACKKVGLDAALAHCNFGLRGEESNRDEAFVRALGRELAFPVYVTSFETAHFAAEKRCSIQEAARGLRYDWFGQLLANEGFHYLLTAHHADDAVETLLINFFRGSGLQGLTSIPEQNGYLLRPLLRVRRGTLQEYASHNGITWVDDSSNIDSHYTRNFIRNEWLPLLRERFPSIDENLIETISRFKDINAFYQKQMALEKKKLCERAKDGTTRVPVRKLLKTSIRPVLFEIIKDFGFGEKQLDDALQLLQAPSGKYIQNERYQIIRHRLWLIIAPVAQDAPIQSIEEGVREILFPNGKLQINSYNTNIPSLTADHSSAWLDGKDIRFPLVLRRWKEGDYFYPLGMRKKKKVARFLIDCKLSKDAKEQVWVVESDKRIIWIVGFRIDDRFKITPSTNAALSISLQSS